MQAVIHQALVCASFGVGGLTAAAVVVRAFGARSGGESALFLRHWLK